MTHDEVEKAVEDGMTNFFTKLGFDVSSPEAVVKIQQDLAFLRRMRIGTSSIVSKVVGFIVLGIMGFVGALITLGVSARIDGS